MNQNKRGQITLVALFGEKKKKYPDLWSLINQIQSDLITIIGKDLFSPYSEERVHGTIIGLEGDRVGNLILNRNAYQKPGQVKPIDLESAIDFVINDKEFFPFSISIGGYKENNGYPFTSQELHPYLRSFSIRGSIAVAMGWPKKDGLVVPSLDRFRRKFNQFNIFHKYHDSDEAFDNDFFFVLGTIDQLPSEVSKICENQIREVLSDLTIPPIIIEKEQINIILYPEHDTTFQNVTVLTLEEAKKYILKLINFYPEISC